MLKTRCCRTLVALLS